ncbi:MAG: DUF3473 domain-containing protein, partial [Chloroflexia bacterium]|nr:DUF3473 domain-containing protein [Chloroflexia bacterium]
AGAANPGAIALQFFGSNQCRIEQVTLRAANGSGAIGLDLGYTPDNGPGLIRHLTVEGFDTGVSLDFKVNSGTGKISMLKKINDTEEANDNIGGKLSFSASSIENSGYIYDSSICPFENFLYGLKGYPHYYYFHSKNLLEIPPSCLKIANIILPWSGGLYFRLMPYFMFRVGFSKIKKKLNGSIIYFHTADFDLEQPKIKCKPIEKFIHYAGLKQLPKKLESFILDFKPQPIIKSYNELLCNMI